ncbi:MAG TPA: ATP-binding protein [Candidatus Limnocylindrales bacterium]
MTSLDLRRPIPRRPAARRVAIVLATAVASLLAATLVVAVLESPDVGIADASPVYLVPVVVVGGMAGTWAAVGTSLAAFLVYDLLFTEPRLSLIVADPREWLDLLLFLFVAVVIGRFAAALHARADEAASRAAEANDLFAISRSLAVATDPDAASAEVADRLRSATRSDRIVISFGPAGAERTVADTAPGMPSLSPAITMNLVRQPGSEPARWVRTHTGGGARSAPGSEHHRVRIELDGDPLGAIVAVRARAAGALTHAETRVLALAADQLAVTLRREELRQTANALEVARQADALKTAILDSVSHDLRTPLAGIRATAGGLADPEVTWTDEGRRRAAAVIDAEASRLDGIVAGLLDLGRIASGALHPDLEAHEPWAVVRPAVDRLRPALGERTVRVDVADDLPPVLVDAVLLDIVVTNLVDNAARHAPAPAPVEIAMAADGTERLVLTVADGGPGVPAARLARLFERLDPLERGRADARAGGSIGIGLSVVKGLVEAMGGSVIARPSALGGLEVAVTLRAVPMASEPGP